MEGLRGGQEEEKEEGGGGEGGHGGCGGGEVQRSTGRQASVTATGVRTWMGTEVFGAYCVLRGMLHAVY